MYNANFLWPHNDGSVEEAGYEFANASTEEYRQQWWSILLERAAQHGVQRTGEQSTAAFDNSDLHSDDREDSNPLFFTRR